MQHTYLRYECADSFSLTTATPSTTTNTTQTLALLANHSSSSSINNKQRNNNNLVVSIAGSQCTAFDLRSGNPPRPFLKFGHFDDTTNIGTGKALNSSECTCLDIYSLKICTGWIDGSIRIFDVGAQVANSAIEEGTGVVNSLLQDSDNDASSSKDAPLVLNGHSNSPITCVAFDTRENKSHLASGSADGSVVVWDIIAETGLFRLLGHNKTISTLHFISPKEGFAEHNPKENDTLLLPPSSFNGLVSTSLDGLVKVWDLDGQCCAQTVGGHRGEVWTSDSAIFDEIKASTGSNTASRTKQSRWRMVTGASGNELRFWAVHAPRRSALRGSQKNGASEVRKSHVKGKSHFMPANMIMNLYQVQ